VRDGEPKAGPQDEEKDDGTPQRYDPVKRRISPGLCVSLGLALLSDGASTLSIHQAFAVALASMAWSGGQAVGGFGAWLGGLVFPAAVRGVRADGGDLHMGTYLTEAGAFAARQAAMIDWSPLLLIAAE